MSKVPQIDTKETGKHLSTLMMQHGLTVKDIQTLLGLSCPQSIYRWLNGRCLPTVDHLYSLSRYFGISIDELLVGDGDKKL